MNAFAGARVAVLSPHLDDAALSVGAVLHRLARAGGEITIVTVLANDPKADVPVGSWDVACGFTSPEAAASTRRAEDLRACAVLGATPLWLPYGDMTYARGADDDEIWRAIAGTIADADAVLVPGRPLVHPDHRWLSDLVQRHREEITASVVLYAEQPYDAGSTLERRAQSWETSRREVAAAAPCFLRRALATRRNRGSYDREGRRWVVEPVAWQDWRAKQRAVLAYRSQLPALVRTPVIAAHLFECIGGGESLAWP
jgi:LmbE family N-acetylglucosaminyl deacetylase